MDFARRPTLVFDIDGVLAFDQETWAAAVLGAFGDVPPDFMAVYEPDTTLPPWQAGWLRAQHTQPDVHEIMCPDWHGADTLDHARAAGFGVIVVSERDPRLHATSQAWLSAWGINPGALFTVGHGNKPDFMRRFTPASPAILIDNNPATILTIASPHTPVWLPARPYVPDVPGPNAWRFPAWDAVVTKLNDILSATDA